MQVYTFFFIRKKCIRKWGSNRQNLKKIIRKSRGSISKIKCFYRPKIGISSLLHSKSQRWNSNSTNESVNHSSQFILVKVKKNLRQSQAQFREMLRKLRLRQNNDFLIKKDVYFTSTCPHWFLSNEVHTTQEVCWQQSSLPSLQWNSY